MNNVLPHSYFSFYSESTCWYWSMFGFRFTWFVLMLFLAIFCLLFLWSCILPFLHEWYSGLALTGTSEVHVVQTNEAIGWSQEMLPTCSKINPMELVLYSSRVSIGEILTASGDPSLEVQPFSQLWLPGALLHLPCQTIPCVCTPKTECGYPEAWGCHT